MADLVQIEKYLEERKLPYELIDLDHGLEMNIRDLLSAVG